LNLKILDQGHSQQRKFCEAENGGIPHNLRAFCAHKNNPCGLNLATAPPQHTEKNFARQLCALRFREFLRHLDSDRRNWLPNLGVENHIKQFDQANPLLAGFAGQKMMLKLLEQLAVLVRRKQDVLQQPGIGAEIVNLLEAGDALSPKA
jgi:hypothetical protein